MESKIIKKLSIETQLEKYNKYKRILFEKSNISFLDNSENLKKLETADDYSLSNLSKLQTTTEGNRIIGLGTLARIKAITNEVYRNSLVSTKLPLLIGGSL